MCPVCKNEHAPIIRRGYFLRSSTNKQRVQRFYCKTCKHFFSERTGKSTYREKKSHLNQALFRLLCSGVSQRRCAFILGVRRHTVARKLVRLSRLASSLHANSLSKTNRLKTVIFDEMETFEHSKCKPLSICIAVDQESRRIIAARVSQMPAKGRLVDISLKKYGPRADHRPAALRKVLAEVRRVSAKDLLLLSDDSPRYPKHVREVLPAARHEVFKGQRGCVVGQGELKRGGFDPLFSLNHTCAMVRDNLKRLSRRTWCTTKKRECLQMLLDLYVCFHNMLVSNHKRHFRLQEAILSAV